MAIRGVSFGGRRGWLHEGRGGPGVVICGSFGFEDLCSRRSLVLLAQAIAAAGRPVLRFDYSGAGDSADAPDDEPRTAIWMDDIRAAVDFMRDQTGESDIALVGIRLGAMLAAAVAPECNVRELALLAPVFQGNRLAREWKAFAAITAVAGDESACALAESGGLSVAGFDLSAQVLSDLRAFRRSAPVSAPARRVFIAVQDGSAALDTCLEQLRVHGCEVTQMDFAGYDRLMCDPTAAEIPRALLDSVQDWIGPGAVTTIARARRSDSNNLKLDGFDESFAHFGLDDHLAGIFATPHGAPGRKAAILVNAGAIHHIGWARQSVDLARSLARAGVASLRMDFSGFGDSAGPDPSSLFDAGRRKEIASAIDLLTARGFDDIAIVGACSGAHHAFHAAVADPRIRSVVLVNMVCILWGPSYALQLRAWKAAKATEMNMLQQEAEAEAEARETLSFAAIALPLAKKFAKGSLEALKSLSASANARLVRKNSVERRFDILAARNVQVRLVYSAGDAGLAELARYMGPGGERALALGNVAIRLIENADHTLTPRHARDALCEEVFDLLDVSAPDAHSRDVAAAS